MPNLPQIPLFSTVLATEINLLDFPAQLGSALGIGTFAGGLLATFILLFAGFAFLGVLIRKRPTNLEVLIIAFAVFGFAVAVAWCPIWVFAVLLLGIAIMYGSAILSWFGRRGG